MNKPVNPWLAAIIIIFFGSLLLLYFWAGSQQLTLGRFGLVKVFNGEKIAFQFDNRLIITDFAGAITAEINLDRFQQDHFTGDIAQFSNGDILLALNHQSDVLNASADNLLGPKNTITPGAEKNVYRCTLPAMQCKRFTSHLPAIKRAFRLYIDDQDRVYVTHTSLHKLWLLDEGGNVLAQQEGFRFPNDVKLIDNKVVVADTNHHAIKQLSADVKDFGHLQSEFAVKLAPNNLGSFMRSSKHTWPIAFERIGNQWWVMVGNNQLTDARIVIYDNAGALQQEITLPEDADPIGMTTVNQKILITDFARYAIYQYDSNGKRLDDFIIPSLQPEIALLQQQNKHWERLKWNSTVVFIISLIAGFAIALQQHFKDAKMQRKKTVTHHFDETLYNNLPPDGLWIGLSNHAKILSRMMPVIVIIVFIILSLMQFSAEKPKFPFLVQFYMMNFSLALMCIPILRFRKFRLGIFMDRLELMDHHGNRHTAYYDELKWNPGFLVISDVVVRLIRDSNLGLFSPAEMKAYVVPRLTENNRLNEWQMVKTQWSSPEQLWQYCLIPVSVTIILVYAFTYF